MSAELSNTRNTKQQLRNRFIYNVFDENLLADFLVNLTNDEVTQLQSAEHTDKTERSYSRLAKEYAEYYICADDREEFLDFFSYEAIVDFYRGNSASIKSGNNPAAKRIYEYKYCADGSPAKWCRAVINCFSRDNEKFAYIYLEDINSYKTWQADLIFRSEHDSLTEMRNKLSTEVHVNDFLKSKGIDGLHALFLFDIDDFKNINSSFGHIFGDVFLARTARKTRELFRKDDILGRIGGDEFVIFMKNLPNRQAALNKADEMIKAIEDRFVLQGSSFKTTVSIGIAFFDRDGKNYQQLIKEADRAMYYCKNNGKNKYAVYTDDMDVSTLYRSAASDSDSNIVEYDASEYVFRTLRDTQDKNNAFSTAIELVGRYYDIDHVSIYELPQKRFTYTYRRYGDEDQNAKALAELFVPSKNYLSSFADGMFYYLEDSVSINPEISEYFDKANCVSAIHYCMTNSGRPDGILCFTRYNTNSGFTQKDTIILRNIANMISTFWYFRNSEKIRGINEGEKSAKASPERHNLPKNTKNGLNKLSK